MPSVYASWHSSMVMPSLSPRAVVLFPVCIPTAPTHWMSFLTCPWALVSWCVVGRRVVPLSKRYVSNTCGMKAGGRVVLSKLHQLHRFGSNIVEILQGPAITLQDQRSVCGLHPPRCVRPSASAVHQWAIYDLSAKMRMRLSLELSPLSTWDRVHPWLRGDACSLWWANWVVEPRQWPCLLPAS